MEENSSALYTQLLQYVRSKDVISMKAWVHQLSKEERTLVGNWLGALYAEMYSSPAVRLNGDIPGDPPIEKLASYINGYTPSIDSAVI